MNTSTILIAGGIVAAALVFSRKANAATTTKPTAVSPQKLTNSKQNPSGNAMLLFGPVSEALGRALGATWAVAPATMQTIDWSTQGNAIGNYTGMTQDQANQQAVTDYNNQFISPWGQSDFAYIN